MARLSLVVIIVLAAGMVARGTELAGEAAGVQRAKEYWAALAKGDPAALKDFYAKEVTLRPGSELLKQDWGIKGAGDRSKALTVPRDELIAGYQRMIEKIGRDKWVKIFAKVPAERVVVTSTVAAAESAALGTQAGDLVLKVRPGEKDDTFSYVLRKGNGSWQVVAELADY
jgi:hypothetical protein